MSKLKSFLITVVILIIGIGISVVFSNQPGPQQKLPEKGDANNYPTVKIQNENISNTVKSTGRVHALNKIELYAEVTGVLEQSSLKFKAGNSFKKAKCW